MDYFAPLNEAMKGATEQSNNALAQAYKLHEFETKNAMAKLQADAAKLELDKHKRALDLEQKYNEAYKGAQASTSANPAYAQFQAASQGPPVVPQMMPAQNDYAGLGNTYDYANAAYPTQGSEIPAQTVEHPARRIKAGIDAVAAENPMAAWEMKNKVKAEFFKSAEAMKVPPAEATQKWNDEFGEDWTTTPVTKNYVHAKKDENVYAPSADGTLKLVAQGNSKDEMAILDRKEQIAAESQARLFAQQEKLANIRQEGLIRAINAKDNKNGSKPLPPSVVKAQAEDLDAIGTASAINADLGVVKQQLDSGKLKLGAVSNAVGIGLNKVGMSTENSRNLATFKSTLEKLRNDSLRLNKGVQTDGDAQRAWNELFANINDTGVVQQRLAEIENINRRAVELRKLNLDTMRAEYGKEPLDVSSFTSVAPALGGKSYKPSTTTNRPLPKF